MSPLSRLSGAQLLVDAAHDLRYAGRTFRHSPGFVLATVLTLSLGIGANTTVFSLADAVLLKMLPVREPERLIQILEPKPPPSGSTPDSRLAGDNDRFTFANYQEMNQTVAPLADLVAESSPYAPPYATPVVIDGAQEAVRYSTVSGNYFEALGVKPVLGRVLEPKIDNEPGRHAEAVISYGYWKRRFDLDPKVISRTVWIGETQFQIIGVAEPPFFGLEIGSRIDLWTPASMEGRDPRRSTFLRLIARLHAGVSARQALAPLQIWYHHSVMDRFGKFGKAAPGTRWYQFARAAQLKAVPAAKGMSPLREKYSEPIKIVFAVVGLVLLLACANVASLLLARASARQREMAVRKSLGAGRMRLIRQLLTESLVLTAVAAVAGTLAVRWTAPVLVSMLAPIETPIQLAVGLDARMLAFVVAVSLITAIAFGIFPAWRASQVDLQSALRSGTGAAGQGHVRQSRILVALQMALSLVLLVASALFVRTLLNLKTLDPGFDRHNIILAIVQFRGTENGDRLTLAWQELLRRITAIPGVESVSASTGGPFVPSRRAGEIRIANTPWNDNLPITWFIAISTNYFRTFGTRLARGRDFEPRDFEPSAPAVAIVNARLAQRFFGNDNPIGRKLNDFGPKPPPGAETIEVVGVATDMKYDSLRTAPPTLVYLPLPQHGSGIKLDLNFLTVELRTRQDSASITPALRRDLAAANSGFVLRNITSVTKLIDDTLIRERLLATVGSFFGILALLLAGIGLYGTMSYSVLRRTQEIGIRMALGAGRLQVLRMLLSEALATVAVGGMAGVAGAIFVGRIVASLLFGLTPQDPSTIVLACGLLVATALLAALLPALRACRIAPMEALRNE